MRFKRLSFCLIIGLGFAGIIGCSQGIGTNSTDVILPFTQQAPASNSGVLCENRLFPVRAGASWMYLNTGGPSGTFPYSDTISEVHEDGFTLTTQYSNMSRSQQWECETDGLKALELGGGTTASITMQGITAEFTTSDISGISLPNNLENGLQWEYSLSIVGTLPMPTGELVQSTGSFSSIMHDMGTEYITVPAGTFEAVKIQSTSIVEILVPFGGQQVPMKYNSTSMVWYAPGVGYIKSIENWDLGGEPYTSTTELQTYVIP